MAESMEDKIIQNPTPCPKSDKQYDNDNLTFGGTSKYFIFL